MPGDSTTAQPVRLTETSNTCGVTLRSDREQIGFGPHRGSAGRPHSTSRCVTLLLTSHLEPSTQAESSATCLHPLPASSQPSS